MNIVVKEPFRDRDDFSKIYKIGDVISHFDDDRANQAVARGLADFEKKPEEKPEEKPEVDSENEPKKRKGRKTEQ